MDLLRNIFKGDKAIWAIYLMLCLISIIEVFSAASTLAYKSGDHWEPITQHSILLMIGAAIVVLLHSIPYKWFQVFPVFIYPISVGLLLFVTGMGLLNPDERINGASRWLSFMGVQFQPSELAKMAVIIVTAFILSKKQDENGANPHAFKYILILTSIVCVLIVPENYSTGCMLFAVVYIMMFVGRVSAKKLLLLGGTIAVAATIFVTFLMATPNEDLRNIFMGHRLTTVKDRLEKFTVQKNDTIINWDKDAQIIHARIAVATSHVIGKGPGNSVQRDFLSQAFSDFIFAIIIEELGLIPAGVIVFLYICILIRAGRIAQKCKRTFPAFLVMGIALLLVSQAILNMLVAVGLFPVTGQPLPLISKGGTSTLINSAYIGMILSISRYTAGLNEQNMRDDRLQMPVEVGGVSDAQTAADPTAPALNSDTEFKN